MLNDENNIISIKCFHTPECGFYIETASEVLIFDWLNAPLPQILGNKPIHFFVSNARSYFFNERIITFINNQKNLAAYIGYDYEDDRVNALIENAGVDIRNKISCFQEAQRLDTDFGRIRSFKALEGVMFFVNTKGLSFLFAGDLSIKRPNTHPQGEKLFKSLVAPLKGLNIDYAMIPLDSSLGAYGELSLYHYLYLINATVFTPTYLRGDYSYLENFITKNPELKKKMAVINPSGRDSLISIKENKPYRINFKRFNNKL